MTKKYDVANPKLAITGLAIALAWPETWCKQAGGWYDGLMASFGFNKKHYYRAGHAAIVLVDLKDGKCHYYDFGRYHAPYKYGRVRSECTDPELSILAKALVDQDLHLYNLHEILGELANNEACHGDGKLCAAVTRVNFAKARKKANQLQEASPISYGPFVPGGTNCSRFVNTVLMASCLSLWEKLRLGLPYTFTPSPMGNLRALGRVYSLFGKAQARLPENLAISSTLPAPARPVTVPETAQWLSGEGAGSWFNIENTSQSLFLVTRYNGTGSLEFMAKFKLATQNPSNNGSFDVTKPFQFVHLCHFREIHIEQRGKTFRFYNSLPDRTVKFVLYLSSKAPI